MHGWVELLLKSVDSGSNAVPCHTTSVVFVGDKRFFIFPYVALAATLVDGQVRRKAEIQDAANTAVSAAMAGHTIVVAQPSDTQSPSDHAALPPPPAEAPRAASPTTTHGATNPHRLGPDLRQVPCPGPGASRDAFFTERNWQATAGEVDADGKQRCSVCYDNKAHSICPRWSPIRHLQHGSRLADNSRSGRDCSRRLCGAHMMPQSRVTHTVHSPFSRTVVTATSFGPTVHPAGG